MHVCMYMIGRGNDECGQTRWVAICSPFSLWARPNCVLRFAFCVLLSAFRFFPIIIGFVLNTSCRLLLLLLLLSHWPRSLFETAE